MAAWITARRICVQVNLVFDSVIMIFFLVWEDKVRNLDCCLGRPGLCGFSGKEGRKSPSFRVIRIWNLHALVRSVCRSTRKVHGGLTGLHGFHYLGSRFAGGDQLELSILAQVAEAYARSP